MTKAIEFEPFDEQTVEAMIKIGDGGLSREQLEELRLDHQPKSVIGHMPLAELMENRPKVNAPEVLAKIKVKLGFGKERRFRVVNDTINFIRKKGNTTETYEDRMKKAREQGKAEAASWGTIRLNGRNSTFFGTDWDYLYGTLGSAVGETYVESIIHARKEKQMHVAVFSSAGARQDEGAEGLFQMPRMVREISSTTKRSEHDSPHVAVLSDQVWGGISASVVPMADVIVGLKGTDFGFAGPKVIEGYTKQKVEKGAQSVEANYIHRNVDMLFDNEDHFLDWLKDFENITAHARRNKSTHAHTSDSQNLPAQPSQHVENDVIDRRQKLYEQFLDLRDNPDRPDGEYLMKSITEDFVPLYSVIEIKNRKHYPAIIAGLGKIDNEVFLLIADQPSYQKRADNIKKISSSPTPADYEYAQRMLEFGERLGVKVISMVDTLGAKPTLEAEYNGQSRQIAKSTCSINTYPNPVYTIVTGLGASGGAVGTMGIMDNLAVVSDGMITVAEPTSSASIIYKTPTPAEDQVKDTIEGMKITAQELLERRLIDTVIPMPGGKAGRNDETIAAIKNHIIRTNNDFAGLTSAKLERKRDRKMSSDKKSMPLTLHKSHKSK
jgi:acyl-CoA carboxylase subunit beta